MLKKRSPLPVVVPLRRRPVSVPLRLVSTVAGAANQIAEEAPYALSPERPALYSVSVPPEPKTLREAVDQQQRTMLISMSVITLVIGAMGIMNTFLVAVMERRREVGLRLAIGMRPSGILLQFSAEALLTGILGAVAGIVLAVNGISIVSLMNRWTPIISADTIPGFGRWCAGWRVGWSVSGGEGFAY